MTRDELHDAIEWLDSMGTSAGFRTAEFLRQIADEQPVAWRWKYRFPDIGETGAYEHQSHDFACVARLPCGEPLYLLPLED